jgi:NTE family protein
MPTRALVLGGGGPVGVAWETGLVAALAENGVDLAAADLVIGTSAGSIVGAQLALGRSPAAMLESQRVLAAQSPAPTSAAAVQSEAGEAGRPGAPDLTPLMQFMARLVSGEADTLELRREIGAFALKAKTMPEQPWLASFGYLSEAGWPEKRFIATAVDAEDGSFVAWERDSGADLGRAVAASCTVPGIFPPVLINGRRYIDGGMRSATNADLAKGFERVVVVAVTAGMGGEAFRRPLDGELEALRASGSEVVLVVPDAASIEAFGPNLMDFSRRAAASDAGYRQGTVEAARLAPAWK